MLDESELVFEFEVKLVALEREDEVGADAGDEKQERREKTEKRRLVIVKRPLIKL